MEDALVTICCEVLGVTEIGVHGSFIKLGGNLLSAARIAPVPRSLQRVKQA